MVRLRNFSASILLLLIGGCGGSRLATARPRAPRLDYPPDVAQTSNGEAVGADRQAPGDKLATGPRVGPGGGSAQGPQGVRGSGGPETPPRRATPCEEIGLEDATGKSHCPTDAVPAKADAR